MSCIHNFQFAKNVLNGDDFQVIETPMMQQFLKVFLCEF